MSELERRVQMLIDHDRYRRLETEAERTGQSVAAVIRTAIDRLLSTTPSVRAAAAASLLDVSREPAEVGVQWWSVKQSLDTDLAGKLP